MTLQSSLAIIASKRNLAYGSDILLSQTMKFGHKIHMLAVLHCYSVMI